MTDRERRLLDAAKEAQKTLDEIWRTEKLSVANNKALINASQGLEEIFQEYFGSERQDT